ncbi:MAG TPA: endo-1,4-beta-xylanase [Verrucomicrobiales bacterium]|nr:endo-1,4-beta-xylanase [Verrucomicrobiales bacterium]
MRCIDRLTKRLTLLLTGVAILGSGMRTGAAAESGNPFGIASGAEWAGDHAKFEPVLRDAGVGWIRYFREWHGMQPKQGEWKWNWADEFVRVSKQNNIQVAGAFLYFAPWASSGGDTRTFPVKDMQYWRDYVSGMVQHYQNDVRYWEVWNEPQSFQKNGTPQHYADMVKAAYESAKKIDPDVKIGLTTANFAVSYLDMVLKAGAKDHFDYLCVHPYENVEQLTRPDGEVYFLSMADSLRRLLAAHQQKPDIPLWITEIGWQAPVKAAPLKEAQQAQLLVKTYILSLAQGFEKVFWFEARGPAYGKGTDHGIIRADWTPRPALTAMKTMTATLGKAPQYMGWVDIEGSYGFLFDNAGKKVLVAWSPAGKASKLAFDSPMSVTDLQGSEVKVERLAGYSLGDIPVFITGVSAAIEAAAKANRSKPFPWGGDFSAVQEVSCVLGDTPKSNGIEATGKTSTAVEKGKGLSFRVNPAFAPYGTKDLEITITARRQKSSEDAGFQLMYETTKTIHGYDRAGWWTIPEGDGWQQHTWRVKDANFVGTWAYNLAITEVTRDFLIREIVVRKIEPAK